MFLTRRTELEHEDAARGWGLHAFRPRVLDKRVETGVAGEHEEVNLRCVGGGGAGAPAQMGKIIFGVDVEVAGRGVGGDFAASEGAFAGFEGDERR